MVSLFNDITFKATIPVNVGFTYANVQSDVESALERYIIPYLSQAQYDASIDSTSEIHLRLIKLVRIAAANIGMGNYMPQGKIQISNGGISYTVDRNKQATPEDKADLQASFLDKGFRAIDDMLRFLEANKSTFTAWTASSSFTEFKKLLIRTADEFKIISGSRTVFLALVPYIEDVEIETIENAVPAEILVTLRSGNYSTKHKELLEKYIRPVIANKALSKGLSSLSVIFNNNTISVFDNSSANQSKGYREASTTKLALYKDDLEHTAINRLVLMASFIKANATDLGYTIPEVPIVVSKPFRNEEGGGTKFF